MFRLAVLPAEDGDCLVLSWGDPGAVRHIVVDGGRSSVWSFLRERLEEIAEAGEVLERFVVTHIDADHIEGALRLARDPDLPLVPGGVWFNGLDQMTALVPQGERQGDDFSVELDRLAWPLNADFANGTACVEAAPDGFSIGELRITVLSPDRPHLAAMAARWREWRDGHGPRMAEFGGREMPRVLDVEELAARGPEDREPPNGSSIAFVAEFRGKRVLLAGDAHPDALAAAIEPLARAEGGRYRVDLYKVSHHGSAKNTSPALARLLDCRRWVVSTNGSRHGHPDPQAIARLLKFAPDGPRVLYFNYRTPRTLPWDDDVLKGRYSYECRWPAGPDPSVLTVDVEEDVG